VEGVADNLVKVVMNVAVWLFKSVLGLLVSDGKVDGWLRESLVREALVGETLLLRESLVKALVVVREALVETLVAVREALIVIPHVDDELNLER